MALEEPTDGPSDLERAALHNLGLGVEHVYRAFGHLLEFHHETGRAMDEFETARVQLREAGHEAFAARLRDDLLPAGAVGDMWTYELVEAFESGLLADVVEFETAVRDALADGVAHVTERDQQRRWRDRAKSQS